MKLLFIGASEMLIIAATALILFGGKKVPELMRGLGRGVSEFKKGMSEITDPAQQQGETNNQAQGQAQPQQPTQQAADAKPEEKPTPNATESERPKE